MESPVTLATPRLRLSRNTHAYERAVSSSSRDHLPEPLENSPTEDSDRDDDQEATPRMTSSVALMDTIETPAARLRALLARSPASSTPMPSLPSRSSDVESDFEPFDASYKDAPSAARESLKDIFSRARRDNTPQKEKITPRRNSIDTSEVDATPRIQRRRTEIKGNRKSLSDEEVDPAKTSEASFRSSQAATFDILRERLINSHSQLKDLRLPDSAYQDSVPDDDNDARFFLQDTNISTTTPPVATSTPQPSLRMSIDSHLPSQSNLLDRDSEMHRAFEGFSSYDAEGASQRPGSFPPSVASAHKTQKLQASHATDSSHASALGTKGQHTTSRPSISHSVLSRDHEVNDSDQFRQHERNRGQPRTPARPHTPDLSDQSPHLQFPRSDSPLVGSSSSKKLSRHGSSASLRSFEKDSSKGSSLGSQADYQERIAELERERNLERERDWNKPHPLRSTSSLGFQPPPTAGRSRTRSLIHVDSRSIAPTRTLQRHHSPTGSSRASSPAGSSVSSHHDDGEIVHERERNWNAPRPKWTHGSPRPISPFKPQSPGTGVKGESLKTLNTRRGESPAQRSHVVTKDHIQNDSASAQAASFLSSLRPDPSPSSASHDHTHSQKLQGTVLPSSSSISSTIIKGKGKARDQSLLPENPVNSSHPDHTTFPTTKSGPSPGFSFVKKRTPLEPIELETDASEEERKDSLSPPTGRSSKDSNQPNGVPIRSPQKSKLSAEVNIRASSPTSAPQSENEEDSFVPDAYDSNSKRLFLDAEDQEDNSSEAGNLSQEGTPTRTTPFPLPDTLEYTPPRASPSQISNGRLDRSVSSLQQRSDSGPTTSQPQIHDIPPTPSLPSHSPSRVSPIKPVSLLLTPPRRPSISKIEFQTPSPPKNMPDLPGPPTSSEDEAEEESTRAPGTLPSDLTAMKTPRPPGAWTYTPALQRNTLRPSLSESSIEHQESNSRLKTPNRNFGAKISATKASRLPSSRASTPSPLPSQEPPAEHHSHGVNTEEEYENGLSTAASFSKGSLSYARTPAPPGAYMVTPAGRKSIMKVRFDTTNNSGSTNSTSRDPFEDITNVSSSDPTPHTTLPQDVTPLAGTLDLSTPISSASRRTKPQKSPGIRVLDAFGREIIKDEAGKAENNVENKNGIRIVDALGRKVEDIEPSHSTEKENASELSSPLEHDEALRRVRRGLADLVKDLNEMDELEQNGQELDYTRLGKLQQTSTEARAARARVSAAISSNAEDIKNKLKPLRATMKESKSFMSSTARRWQTSRMFCCFLVVQLILAIAMYRISATQARELFLTTYYNPFYPDLHLYITQPNTLQLSMHDFSGASWFTIPNTFYLEGWKASTLQIWHNLLIVVWNWQQLLWDKVGEGSPQITSWPPT